MIADLRRRALAASARNDFEGALATTRQLVVALDRARTLHPLGDGSERHVGYWCHGLSEATLDDIDDMMLAKCSHADGTVRS